MSLEKPLSRAYAAGSWLIPRRLRGRWAKPRPPAEAAAAERRARRNFFDAAAPVTPLLAAETDVGTFVLSTADHGGKSRDIFHSQAVAGKSLRLALQLARERGWEAAAGGRAFVDVGAHIGTFTLCAAARHGFERVLAVEPEPGNRRLLAATLALNDLDARVRVSSYALADREGTALLQRHTRQHGMHGLAQPRLEAVLGEHAGETVEVETTTLERLLEIERLPVSELGMLKLDCQGQDARVLAAAPGVLESGVPVIFEYWPPGVPDPEADLELFERVAAASYAAFADLRAPEVRLRPMDDLPELRTTYADGGTDLLLVG